MEPEICTKCSEINWSEKLSLAKFPATAHDYSIEKPICLDAFSKCFELEASPVGGRYVQD